MYMYPVALTKTLITLDSKYPELYAAQRKKIFELTRSLYIY